jgi:hypothetical protein
MNGLLSLCAFMIILVIMSRGSPSLALSGPLRWLWRAAQLAACLAVVSTLGMIHTSVTAPGWWQTLEPYLVLAFMWAPALVLYTLAVTMDVSFTQQEKSNMKPHAEPARQLSVEELREERPKLKAIIAEQSAVLERLREQVKQLKEYAQHKPTCEWLKDTGEKCDCGLADAMAVT